MSSPEHDAREQEQAGVTVSGRSWGRASLAGHACLLLYHPSRTTPHCLAHHGASPAASLSLLQPRIRRMLRPGAIAPRIERGCDGVNI
jgi:hypothetical protein